jgi:pimeloyl-ACP methyl ester carboxylesterase
MVLSVTFIRCPLPRWFVGLSQFIATFSRPPRFQVRAQLTGLAAPPELVDEMQLAIAGAEKRVLAARIGAVRTLDDSAILRRSTTPLLYLQAQFDRLIPAGNAAMIQQLRPDTTIVRLPTPHILLRVAAKEAWRAIHRFLPSPPPADLRQ